MDLQNSPSRKTYHQEEVQQLEGIIDCPRCGSKKTKFCYYNNYNKSQPRHFCKGCKRHWTKGGTLRKVPVGGGRKNKRLKTPNSAENAVSGSSAAVPKPCSTTNRNILMNHDQDCHDIHLGAHEGLKAMTDHEKNISDILFENNSHEDGNQNFSFSSSSGGGGGLDHSYQFDGNYPSNYTSNYNTVFNPPWESDICMADQLMPNCWNFNDFDTLISATDLNVPWPDDIAEINPGSLLK